MKWNFWLIWAYQPAFLSSWAKRLLIQLLKKMSTMFFLSDWVAPGIVWYRLGFWRLYRVASFPEWRNWWPRKCLGRCGCWPAFYRWMTRSATGHWSRWSNTSCSAANPTRRFHFGGYPSWNQLGRRSNWFACRTTSSATPRVLQGKSCPS